MPTLETLDRHQKAVLWEKVEDDTQGEPLVGDPVELTVRWEKIREEIQKPDSTIVALGAEVVVDRKIPIGSIMWLGELEEWYGTGSQGEGVELMQVQVYEEIPDLKNRYTIRTVKLDFFRGSLPAHV